MEGHIQIPYALNSDSAGSWSKVFDGKESCNLSLNGKMDKENKVKERTMTSRIPAGFQFHISMNQQQGDYSAAGRHYSKEMKSQGKSLLICSKTWESWSAESKYAAYIWRQLFRPSQPKAYKATGNESTGNSYELSRSRRRDDEREGREPFSASQSVRASKQCNVTRTIKINRSDGWCFSR